MPPIYEFENLETGEIVERYYEIGKAPRVGQRRRFKGVLHERRQELFSVSARAAAHFYARTLPKNYRHHANTGGEFDSEGRCVFTSHEQIRKTVAEANKHGEELSFDKSQLSSAGGRKSHDKVT